MDSSWSKQVGGIRRWRSSFRVPETFTRAAYEISMQVTIVMYRVVSEHV